MNNGLRKTIFDNFLLKETDELVEIWITNDRVEWSDTAFEVIQEILEQELDELPPQNEPIFEYIKQSVYDSDDQDLPWSKFTDPENAPLLYKPDGYPPDEFLVKSSVPHCCGTLYHNQQPRTQ